MELDELLATAAPAVSARTPELQVELDALMIACEASQRRRRMPVRMAVVGSVVAVAVGAGSVAYATGIMPGWSMLKTRSGQVCEVEVRARPTPPGDGESISATFSHAEQLAALDAAQLFLGSFDYKSVDHQSAIADWRAIESDIREKQRRQGVEPSERQPRLTEDDLEVTAVTHEVIERLRDDLAAQGHDLRAVTIAVSSTGCEL